MASIDMLGKNIVFKGKEEVKKFIYNINNTLSEQDSIKILEITKGYRGARDFYKLCQAYLDIALNAEITTQKNPEILKKGEIENVVFRYKHEDMAVAYKKTRRFILNYLFFEYEELFMMISHRYQESISPDENRPKKFVYSSVSCDGEANYNDDIYMGTEYDTTKIRAWNDVKADMIKSLTK